MIPNSWTCVQCGRENSQEGPGSEVPSVCVSCGAPAPADPLETGLPPSLLLHTKKEGGLHGGTPVTDEDLSALVGTTLGACELTQLLGMGGMGAVYQGHHKTLGIDVAVKIIRPSALASSDARDRFVREAQATVSLEHENIMRLYNLGEDRGLLYIVMQHLPGPSLARVAEERAPLPAAEAVLYAVQLLEALDYAHEKGFIHRDVKPDNLMFDKDGRLRLTDFGLTRSRQESKGITQTGAALGTPLFMPIEQWDNEKVDRRADIYAAGVTLYHLLSGEFPFDAESPSQVLIKLVSGKSTPLEEFRPDLPKALVKAVEKMTAKEKRGRHATARAAVQDLLDAMKVPDAAALETVTQPVPGAMRSRVRRVSGRHAKSARKSRFWILAVPVAIFLVALVATLAILRPWGGSGTGTGGAGDSQLAAPQDPAAEEARSYEAARTGSVEVCASYLEAFPDGPHAAEIRSRFEELEETRLYEAAARSGSKECATYLEAFPESPRSAEIRARLAAEEEKERNSKSLEELDELCKGAQLEKTLRLPRDRYVLRTEIVIAPHGRLVLRPGTELVFGSGAGVICFGTLLAEGTEEEPIRFMAESPERGWRNLCFLNATSSSSRFVNCVLSQGRGSAMNHRYLSYILGGKEAGTFGGLVLTGPDAGPSFERCTFQDSRCQRWGGGAFVIGGNPQFHLCAFERNRAQAGGGVYCWRDTAVFTLCRFEGNEASDCAGAFCNTSSTRFVNCSFLKNVAEESGGGLGLIMGFAEVEGTRFEGNRAKNGGGVLTRGVRATLRNCDIIGNTASEKGGGAHVADRRPPTKFIDCRFEGNKPDDVYDLK